MAFKPSDRRKFVAEAAELNLLPILNMIVVLIPLLLVSSEWVKLGLLETRLPPSPAGGGGSAMAQEQEQALPKLSLLVAVDPNGVGISIFGATSASGEPGQYTYLPRNADGGVDFAGVNSTLYRIRKDVVKPTVAGKIQAVDSRGKARFTSSGAPVMVDNYGFEDAETVLISAPNEMPFQDLVHLLDVCRSWEDPETKRLEVLFPSPLMGKVN